MLRGIKKSLVARLVSTYLVLALVVIASVGAASWLAGRQLLRDAAFARLDTTARQKELNLGQWIDERLRDLFFLRDLIGNDLAHHEKAGRGKAAADGEAWADIAAVQAHLVEFRNSQPDIMEVMLLAPVGGKVLASSEPESVGGWRATYNFYTQGRLGPAVQSVYAAPDTLRSVLTISTPVKDGEGRLVGVLAVHLSPEPIARMIRTRAGLDTTGETYLVDSSSLLVASGRGDPQDAQRKTSSQGVLRALAGKNGQGLYLNDAGVPVVGVYRWIPAYHMALLAEMSQAEAFAPAGRLALVIMLVALFAAVVLAAGVYSLSRKLARPVLEVTSAAMRVAAGELSVRAPVQTSDELGNLARAFNAMTDELTDLYARLEEEGRERGAILQGSFDGISVVSRSGAVAYCNPGMERLFGCTLADTPSLAVLADRIFPNGEERQVFINHLLADMGQVNPPERVFAFEHVAGGRRWCRMKVSPIGGDRVVINAQDLTDMKASEERVRHMALHDQLTGLPNRQLFIDRLDQAMRRARRVGAHVALLYIDLDRFKSLNDAYGHAHGDRVLVETALRLRACVRESDTVARLGGDEFVVVLPDLMHLDDALPVAEKVQESLYDPQVGGGRLFLGASIGVAGYPEHGLDQDALLARADNAMYEAKHAGGNAVRVALIDPSPEAA